MFRRVLSDSFRWWSNSVKFCFDVRNPPFLERLGTYQRADHQTGPQQPNRTEGQPNACTVMHPCNNRPESKTGSGYTRCTLSNTNGDVDGVVGGRPCISLLCCARALGWGGQHGRGWGGRGCRGGRCNNSLPSSSDNLGRPILRRRGRRAFFHVPASKHRSLPGGVLRWGCPRRLFAGVANDRV